MDRPSCSYWVTIHGTESELNKVLTQLQSERLDPNSILQSMTIHGDQEELRLEVTDGAMDQTDEIYTMCEKLAADHPAAQIRYEECNEELFSPDVLIEYANGEKCGEAYGRRLSPREVDSFTINHCIDLLAASATVEEAVLKLKALL